MPKNITPLHDISIPPEASQNRKDLTKLYDRTKERDSSCVGTKSNLKRLGSKAILYLLTARN